MKVSWFWMLAAVACLGAAAQDDGDERRDAGGKYVVYRKTDYKGTVSYHIIMASKFRQRLDDAAKSNKMLKQAHDAARKAWEEDDKNKGVRFPMRPPRRLRLAKMSTYSDRLKAEDAALKRQDKLDARTERLREREERRLERLTETVRKRDKEKADALSRAEKLFERNLGELLKEPKEEKKDASEEAKPAP